MFLVRNKKFLALVIVSVFFMVGFYSNDESRMKIALLDSGLRFDSTTEAYLCKNGHRSFVNQNKLQSDLTGHGTLMFEAMKAHLDADKHCIVIYQIYPGSPAPEAYAQALHAVMEEEFSAIVLAIEDKSYFLNEALWLKKIADRTRVFVAAGNGGKDLNKECNVFPACLSRQINSENFRVVGSDKRRYNINGPVNELYPDEIKIKNFTSYGTSISTAIAAAVYVSHGKFHPAIH